MALLFAAGFVTSQLAEAGGESADPPTRCKWRLYGKQRGALWDRRRRNVADRGDRFGRWRLELCVRFALADRRLGRNGEQADLREDLRWRRKRLVRVAGA